MMMKRKNKVITVVMTAFFLGMLALISWTPVKSFSDSERRSLKQFPKLSVERIISGKFMEEFENYALDQFPGREWFRSIKAASVYGLFGQRDNRDIYMAEGHISKMEYPQKEESLNRVWKRFQYVYDHYLENTKVKVYFSMIPDKNYFLAEKNGYLSMNYKEFWEKARENTEFMEYIDIVELLEADDYYKTDIHWRQEKIIDVAEKIANEMGVTLYAEYEVKTLDIPFYGVYYGQSAIPLEGEELNYLSNDVLENCMVYDYQNQNSSAVYDMEKAYGKDAYEMYLSGALSLVTIENEKASTDRELVIFRDSFGSSIAPLWAEAYKKITLVDIRYMHPDVLKEVVEFKEQDVLFLYSTLVLNHGELLK